MSSFSSNRSCSLHQIGEEEFEDTFSSLPSTPQQESNTVADIVRSDPIDMKTPSEPGDVVFTSSPDPKRVRKKVTPSGKLRLTPPRELSVESTMSSGAGYDGNEYYFIPHIADGIQKIPAEVQRDMKRKVPC